MSADLTKLASQQELLIDLIEEVKLLKVLLRDREKTRIFGMIVGA